MPFGLKSALMPRMAAPQQPVSLSPEQIADLNRKLSDARHNVNNYLALIVAATELMRRKPETAERMLNTLAEQPERIVAELQKFSRDFEQTLGINRP